MPSARPAALRVVPRSHRHGRIPAPECETGELYSPFKMDIWQLGSALNHFRTRKFPAIDAILEGMIEPDWKVRKGSTDTLNALRDVVYAIPPQSLLIDPDPEFLLYPPVA
ncbi:hypothetical protein CPC08DRAFT_818002 [Agrocybe pediades]|nr:hypothetical protein CPC08DRAFT_818002 [Agrocybe pediades]